MEGYFLRKEVCGEKTFVSCESGKWVLVEKGVDVDLLNPVGKFLELLEKNSMIIDESNIDSFVSEAVEQRRPLKQGPSLHIVVPTIRCNHKCAYCHSKAKGEDSSGSDMDIETASKTLDVIFQTRANSITIEFQGGEPLLNFRIVKYFIEEGKKRAIESGKKVSFDLVTNLSVMTDEIAEYLVRENVSIATSLDGPDFIHNKNRFYSEGNSYEKVVYWIKRFKDKYDKVVNGMTVVTKHSLGYHKEIADEFVKLELPWTFVKSVDNLGYAKNNDIGVNFSEYIEFWTKYVKYLFELDKKQGITLLDKFVFILTSKLKGVNPFYAELQSPCGAAIGQIAYDQKGDIYTCDEARVFDEFKIGNVFKDKLSDVLSCEKVCSIVASSVNETLICDSCAFKPYCGVCPVCNYANKGTLVPLLSQDDRCKILKAQFSFVVENMSNENSKILEKWFRRGVKK